MIDMAPERQSTQVNFVYIILGGLVILSFAGFFIFPTGKANNFPTYLAAILALVLLARSEFPKSLLISPTFLGATAFLLYLSASFVWSPEYTVGKLLNTLIDALLILLMLASIAFCQMSVKHFRRIFCYSLVVVAGLAASVYLVTSLLNDSGGGILWGRWQNTNIGAMAFGAIGTVGLGTIAAERIIWLRTLATPFVLALIFAAYLLNVGYVELAMATGMSTICLGRAWQSRNPRQQMGWILVFLAILLIFKPWTLLVEAMPRSSIWSPALETSYEGQLLFGAGYGASVPVPTHCADDMQTDSDCNYSHPHNGFISTLYYGGLVGLCLLGLLLLIAGSQMSEFRNTGRLLVLGTLTYALVILTFDGTRLIEKIDFIWLIFWLPIALVISCEAELRLRQQLLDEDDTLDHLFPRNNQA
ncbi:MAG: hypothetical protein KDI36_14705 [Pseudomonadales bacterium]|nr:hypothetical protein [Pseudomonadales bacterium]